MEDKHLYDITEICRMLGTTSRTLRFYEENKIIASTTVGVSARRKYTEEQLLQIKNVLVLRSLGLSVKSIAELQKEQSDLKNAVLSKRAEIYASIEAHIKDINLLNEAVSALEQGKNIFDGVWQICSDAQVEELEIARLCTDAIISNDDDVLYRHLSSRLLKYMPKDVYDIARRDTLAALGDFLGIDEIAADKKYSNKIFSKVRYSKLGLMITFVFHAGKIDGLWLGYYDSTRR